MLQSCQAEVIRPQKNAICKKKQVGGIRVTRGEPKLKSYINLACILREELALNPASCLCLQISEAKWILCKQRSGSVFFNFVGFFLNNQRHFHFYHQLLYQELSKLPSVFQSHQ